jgi:hypothetical protein
MVDHSLVLPGNLSELPGQGEGEEIILGLNPFVQLVFNPLLGFMALAVRTTSMSTGMGDITLIGAIVAATANQHLGAEFSPAEFHTHQCLIMTG